MVLHNPNNWHWVNKDTSGWARSFLETELIGTSVSKDGVSASVDKVLNMDGDVDVSQRKGKVITLFDVKLQLEYSGRTKPAGDGEEKEGEEVGGTITVPEVAHDTEESEYVFDIDIYSETTSKEPVKTLVRSDLTPILRKKLATLGPALIAAHGAGLQHARDTSNGTTSTVKSSSSVSKDSSSTSTSSNSQTNPPAGPKINTTTVSLTDEFRTTASELYTTFTSSDRLAAFTRTPPSPFPSSGTAEPDAEFGLFGGNVTGTYKTLAPPTKILQSWRLAQWPAGHHAQLELGFDQNDVDRVTVMRVEFKGVPVGQEEVVRRNWEGYYTRQIKGVFGFGTIL
ncbi:MAG: hypothetical protein M1828_002269 [Chrysothrix sp. TS-e1954]|nr:MAG: hypothetical protein M1828_002269 [Chrysothrix sp. TS-e1954]